MIVPIVAIPPSIELGLAPYLVQIQATFFAITCLRCSTYWQLK
jgi:hypothetical protein